MKHTNLYNNVRMPLLGIGTFMISPEDTDLLIRPMHI